MVKRTGPTNETLKALIMKLKEVSVKENVAIWKRVAKDLEKPTRNRRSVNLYKINKYLNDDETAVVPGVVLSVGDYERKNTVAAFKFSEVAQKKINKTGKAISIEELLKKNSKGKKVRIIG